VIVFAGEQRLRFELSNVALCDAELTIELFQKIVALIGVGFFLRQVDVRVEVTGKSGELLIRADAVFGALALAKNVLCGFLIVPEIGLRCAGFQRFQTLAILRGVKESSAPARCAA